MNSKQLKLSYLVFICFLTANIISCMKEKNELEIKKEKLDEYIGERYKPQKNYKTQVGIYTSEDDENKKKSK